MVITRRMMTMGLGFLLIVAGLAAAPPAGASSEIINVTASIDPYAQLTCDDDTLTLAPFTGESYEERHKQIHCTIVSNTAVNLHVEFQPLQHDDDDTVKIATALMMEGEGPEEFSVRLISPFWDASYGGPPGGGGDWHRWLPGTEAILDNVQGKGTVNYTLSIWGRLGAADKQLAGTYGTDVVLTISLSQ